MLSHGAFDAVEESAEVEIAKRVGAVTQDDQLRGVLREPVRHLLSDLRSETAPQRVEGGEQPFMLVVGLGEVQDPHQLQDRRRRDLDGRGLLFELGRHRCTPMLSGRLIRRLTIQRATGL